MSSENRIENIHLPQPDEISEKDREYAFGAYIMMFAGAYFPLPFIEIISSFIYYAYYVKRSRYAAFHAYQSCLSQLPITVLNTGYAAYVIVWFVKSIRVDYFDPYDNKLVLIFLIITIAINIIYIIVSLSIAFKAKKGIFRYFPFVGKIAYEKFYGSEAVIIINPELHSEVKNKPPE